MQLNLTHSISELAKMRHSVRSFKPQVPEQELIKAYMEPLSNTSSLFKSNPRYDSIFVEQIPGKLGTYGMVKGAKSFLLAVAPIKEIRNAYLQIGYQMEQSVFIATDRGLGTCWLGGTFDKTTFYQAANVQKEEKLAVIMPIGYPADNPHLFAGLARRFARSDSRIAFEKLFFNAKTGNSMTEGAAGKFAKPLSCVRLAPSAINKQPWRIYLTDSAAFLFMHSNGKQGADDLHYVDMGIAAFHFEAAAKEAGLSGSWNFEPPTFSVPNHLEYIVSWKID